MWNLNRKIQEWDIVFEVACWLLWQWRNHELFEEDFVLQRNLGAVVKWYVGEIRSARIDFGRILGTKVE